MKSRLASLSVSLVAMAGCAVNTGDDDSTAKEIAPADSAALVSGAQVDIVNPQGSASMYTESVQVTINNAMGDFCTGVLVAPSVLLTASHCIVFNPNDDGAGPHGTWTITVPFAKGGAQTFTASNATPMDAAFYDLDYDNYDAEDSALHDIGLVFLDTPVPSTANITYPSISATRYPLSGAAPSVQAVGRASVSKTAALVLSPVETLAASTVAQDYPHDNYTSLVTTGGDSGGPLFLDGTHTLVGTETRFDPTNKWDYWCRLDNDVYDFISSGVETHGGFANPLFDFGNQVSTALCARITSCCTATTPSYSLSSSACRDVYNQLGLDATARDLMIASTAHVTTNTTKLATCITDIGNLACTVTSAELKQAVTDCVAAVTGSVAIGGACTYSVECAGAAVCEKSTAGVGTCNALHGSGTSCEVVYKTGTSVDERYDLAQDLCSTHGDGDTGLYCDGFDFTAGAYKTESTWTCKAANANGASCGGDSDCTSYLCAPEGAAGQFTCVSSTTLATSAVCSAFSD